MRSLFHSFAAALVSGQLMLSPASAQDIEVDVELALMVDVSRSMSPAELEIQRRGYAEALTSDVVVSAIQSGLLGRVAISYVEWAGDGSQRVIVDWRLLETREDAENFAETLTAQFNSTLRRTSISSALLFGADWIKGNGYAGLRRVIDVSGDGPNNHGQPVVQARDEVLAQDIIINGLPLMTRDGMGARWHLDDLDVYYRNCAVGGPGAFVIPVLTWPDFAMAVRRKLVLELVGVPPLPPQPAQARIYRAQQTGRTTNGGYDCLIGEKIWQRNWGDNSLP